MNRIMWLKRKRKNRRLESAHLLDVKLRSSQVRAGRMKIVGVILAVLFVALFVVVAVWHGGRWLLDRFIYENDVFAIQQIDVQPNGIIGAETLRRFAHVKPGANLLALDLNRVKRDLELVPWIQSAAVERVLPRTLILRVTEREPIAQVLLHQRAANGAEEELVFQLDEKAFVMRPLEASFRAVPVSLPEQLPRILGVAAGELRTGRRIESAQLQGALRLLMEYDQSPMAGLAEIEAIDISMPEILRVTTNEKSEIVFSLEAPGPQLTRWRLVRDYFQQSNKAITTLDLSISNNLPLHFVEAAGMPPSVPKSLKPPRTRKKHV